MQHAIELGKHPFDHRRLRDGGVDSDPTAAIRAVLAVDLELLLEQFGLAVKP